jgi:hypothetical protein
MHPRSPRPRRKPRRRKPTRKEFYARVERRSARNKLRDAAGWRASVALNVFWADCPGALCRRTQRCQSADPKDCFHHSWAGLDENDRRFRRDFMSAFARLRDRDEAMVEAIARALLRRESAASGEAARA